MSNRFGRDLSRIALTSVAVLIVTSAAAQEPTPTEGGTPAVPPPAVATTSVTLMPGPHCVLAPTNSVDPGDAESATSFVCDALNARGVPVGTMKPHDAPLGGDRFVVNLRKLGTRLFVQLDRVSGEGSTVASARMELSGIEEMVNAAPRLVDSTLTGVPIAETQTHDNLTSQDVEEDIHSEKRVRMKFGGGFTAMTFLGAEDASYVAGLEAVLFYQSHQFGIGFLGRAALNLHSDGAAFLNGSLAGRYFFTPAEISPFVGGGVGLYAFAVRNGEDSFGDPNFDSNLGLGAHGEVGLEFMRFSRTRIGAVARVDAPFFKAGGDYVIPAGLSVYMLIR